MDGFDAFVAARGPALLRSAYLLTGDRQLAEDVVQEALSRVIGRWGRLMRHGDPEAYVRRVVYSAVVDRSRRRSSGELVSDQVDALSVGGGASRASADGADDVLTRLTLHDALSRLTGRQRQVLVLRFYEDLSELHTAEVMGCSPGTVKSQTAHALRRLRVLAPELAETFGRDEPTPTEVRR